MQQFVIIIVLREKRNSACSDDAKTIILPALILSQLRSTVRS